MVKVGSEKISQEENGENVEYVIPVRYRCRIVWDVKKKDQYFFELRLSRDKQ